MTETNETPWGQLHAPYAHLDAWDCCHKTKFISNSSCPFLLFLPLFSSRWRIRTEFNLRYPTENDINEARVSKQLNLKMMSYNNCILNILITAVRIHSAVHVRIAYIGDVLFVLILQSINSRRLLSAFYSSRTWHIIYYKKR